MFVWPHPPNWSSSFEVTLRFLTDINVSRNGKQQRIAQRFEPRMAFEFTSLAKKANFMAVQRELFQELRNEIVMPFWPDRRFLAASASGATVSVTEARPWMQAGATLCIVKDGRGEAATIASRTGTTITLTAALTGSWEAGSSVLEGFKGRMDQKTTQRGYTDEVNAVSVAFEVTPGSEPDYDAGAPVTTFDGLEVFDFPVNWSAAPRVEIEDPRIMLDYNYGVNRVYHPFDFPTVIRRFQLLRNGFDAAREVENFFRRHRGRQREFYIPNLQRDLRAAAGIVSGANTLTVEGAEVAAYLNGNTIHRAVAVKTPSGWRYNQIESAVAGAGTTIITMRNNWTETVSVGSLGRIGFLNVVNFASDAFSLEWVSDNVATTVVTISTLEDFWSAA